MKWRELVEGQSEESYIITMGILQSDNDIYAKTLKYIMDKADEDIPKEMLEKIREVLEDENNSTN